MVFKGRLWKKGKFWVVDVPLFRISSQGRSRKEALSMIAEAMQLHVNKRGFKVKIAPLGKSEFVISSNHAAELIALLLRRERAIQHLTVRQVAKLLGYSSPSAYAQYETGKHIPGLDKLSRFLRIMNPKAQVALDLVAA
jgi:predicted RNase H-like HicB family nuclease